jgi:hypothetical protein
MEAFTGAKISIDLFVAVNAELGLCAFFEAHMTAGTLGLVFCVSLDHFARHQQGFDVSSACGVHKENAHRNKY